MPKPLFGDLLLYLRKVCGSQAARDLTDAQLLERFRAHRDEVAFSVLVHRHGPMLLSVCRRVLGDAHGAEDAFQATFMVLVRRAASISCTGSLGGWLQAVAQRVATKARNQETTRRRRERRLEPMRATEPLDDLTWQELRGVLDEEIARLAEKYRTPLVLCYFEGKSYDQAARELGWPKSSLTRRLSRARELLRQRLVRRGMALSAGVLATALCEKVSGAPVGAMLTINTVKAAMSMAAGKAVAGACLSARAIALTEEAVTGMLVVKAKVLVVVLGLGLAVGGAGLAGYNALSPSNKQPTKVVEAQKQSAKIDKAGTQKKDAPAPTDLYGDPLPDGVLARLGTVRFRHDFQVSQVAFTPDGKTLISGGGTVNGIGIWDAATGRPLLRLSNPSLCNNLALSPDGKLLFTEHLRLIEVATGKEVRRLKVPNTSGFWGGGFVAFSPDGKTVAAAESYAERTNVVLWDLGEGKGFRTLEGHTSSVSSGAFSPDGKTLASGSNDKTVRLWDIATGKEIRRFEGDQKGIHSVVFSPDGKAVAAAGEDSVIRLWEVDSGKLSHQMKADHSGHTVAFSPDGKMLASGGLGGIILWDLATAKEIRRCPAQSYWVHSLAFAPDGKVLASVGSDSAVRLWDIATGKEINPVVAHTGRIMSLRFSPGGQKLFSTAGDSKVLEWDVATGQPRREFFPGPLDATSEAAWRPAGGILSPDGTVLAQLRYPLRQGETDCDVYLWDTLSGKEIRTLKGHREAVERIRFSPDGKLMASAANDGIRLWEVGTGKELHHLQKQSRRSLFAFSPDGKWLASGGLDNTICLWETTTGKEIRSWDSQQQFMWCLEFSPDGKVIASADIKDPSPGGGVRIWSANSGKELLRFGVKGDAASMVFSPTGRILATAGEEHRQLTKDKDGDYEGATKVYLWDAYSGKEIRQFEAPQGTVRALAFTPDSRALATGGGDSSILLWDVTGHANAGKLKVPGPLAAKELTALWSDLVDDAAKADRAIWTLALAPKQSLPKLKEALRPLPPAPGDQVAKLIADLDTDRFAVRQEAAKTLEQMGEAAEGALRKAMKGKLPLEVHQRVQQLLEKGNKDLIRKLRAIEVVEHIGTPEARQLLEALAKEAPNPRIAEAASAALQRLAKRP